MMNTLLAGVLIGVLLGLLLGLLALKLVERHLSRRLKSQKDPVEFSWETWEPEFKAQWVDFGKKHGLTTRTLNAVFGACGIVRWNEKDEKGTWVACEPHTRAWGKAPPPTFWQILRDIESGKLVVAGVGEIAKALIAEGLVQEEYGYLQVEDITNEVV